MTKEIKAAWIGGICVIIAAVIGGLSFNIDINMDDIKAYKNLQLENNDLQNQILLLTEENTSLKEQIQNLESELEENNSEKSVRVYIQTDNNIYNNDLFIQIISVTAHIHTAPENSSSIIATAKQDDKILYSDTIKDKDGSEWYEVLVGNQIGYVRSYLAKEIE